MQVKILRFRPRPWARAVLCAAFMLALAPPIASAQDLLPLKLRNLDVPRSGAKEKPRGEEDQAIVNGWPLYRTDRGQRAFNDAMATLAATDGPAPGAEAFAGCEDLACNLDLPAIGEAGWIPPGRLWVSPEEYVLIAHSPRNVDGKAYRRRDFKSMRIFVYHEFQNSTLNTDIYDTISSHAASVFVPLYMSKPRTDAYGHRFVTIVQVAPYDVISVHASNMGSAGPGMEVAKNSADPLDPLQAKAGVLVGVIVKRAAPHLRVVNHRGSEGRPMLAAYERRLEKLAGREAAPALALPFVPAREPEIATASTDLGELVLAPGAAPRRASLAAAATGVPAAVPQLVIPLTRVTRSVGPPEPEFTLVEPIRPAARPAASEPAVSGG